jgi:hypothetical protein
VLIFRTITSGPCICEAKTKLFSNLSPVTGLCNCHNANDPRWIPVTPSRNITMPCGSLSPTLENIKLFSRFVEYRVMTFGERKSPNVVTFIFSNQCICNVNDGAWVFYLYFVSSYIHISFVSIGNGQLIFSRNWQLRKIVGRLFEVCCVLVEVSFMHFWGVIYVIILTLSVFFWHTSCLWIVCKIKSKVNVIT